MVGGGVESILMSINKYIDKNKFEVDLLVDEDSKIVPEKEIKSLGINLIYIPPYQSIIRYLWALRNLFSKRKYDIVHANISALNVFPLAVAYFCHVKVRISHNHNLISPNAGVIKNTVKWLLAQVSNVFPNYRIAPTYKTGAWVFKKKKFFVIKNGIEPERFVFNLDERKAIRNKLNIDSDKILIGSFGRLISSKNIFFALKIMEELDNKYKLLIIGSGVEEAKLKNYVISKRDLRGKIIFLPSDKDVSYYYSALDLYIFPSTAEAFGMASVESQANGLYTLVSTGVPDESKVLDELFIKIKTYDIQEWKETIMKIRYTELSQRLQISNKSQNKVFDSKKMVKEIEELYTYAVKTQGKM